MCAAGQSLKRAHAVKVLIVGGTGVFGSRLAERLVASGHDVIIGSRTQDIGQKIATTLNTRWEPFDLSENVAAALKRIGPQIVVDAAGPYQAYGAGAYTLAKAAIDERTHYLDLSDDAAFTQGITALSAAASSAGVSVLSGVSSVPALSSAIIADLAHNLSDITLIESAIMPGNRAPRGRSVMAAILQQIGEPISIWRSNKWTTEPGWSGQKSYRLNSDVSRKVAFIGAPDLALFPAYFKARSVLFRAGLELPVFQQSLRLFSWLRSKRLLPRLDRLLWMIHPAANALEGLGSDVGAMVVTVCGRGLDGIAHQRLWRAVIEAGDGPYVPTLAAEALINRWHDDPPAPGARACICEHSRAEMEDRLNTLNATIDYESKQTQTLFEKRLGRAWNDLPKSIRRLHDVWDHERFQGRARVVRSTKLLARIIAAAFGFPPTSDDVEAQITMTRAQNSERWVRQFGRARFQSELTLGDGPRLYERFGPIKAELDLQIHDGALWFPVKRAWCLGIALPKCLTPISQAREYVREDRLFFDVSLALPGIGQIVQYQGWLAPSPAP